MTHSSKIVFAAIMTTIVMMATILSGCAETEAPGALPTAEPEPTTTVSLQRQAALPSHTTFVAHPKALSITAYTQPGGTVEAGTFDNPTPRGGPLVFKVVGQPDLSDPFPWIEVDLPIRPNGSRGWVRKDEVSITHHSYRIDIDTSDFALTVFHEDSPILQTTVALGDGATPTPYGEFYLIELLKPTVANGPYGSYAYGLSGHSDTLDSFNGGDGAIGIHGTNRPDLLGTTVSHGCIRVHNEAIEEMVEYLPLGTPVSIHR